MPFSYRRGSKWWIAFKDVAGRWRRKSVMAAGKKEADALAYELERKAERVRMGLDDGAPEGGDLTVGELVRWYLDTYSKGSPSHATNKGTIEKHILPAWIAKLTVREAKPGRFEQFLQEKSMELAPQTLNHLRGYFSRAFNKGRRAGKLTSQNPITEVAKRKVPRRAADYLKFGEVLVVLAALTDRWRPLFAAAIYAGLRKGELLALRKSDVDLVGRVLLVSRSHGRNTTKNGKPAAVPINVELVPYLEAAMAASTSELVFPGKGGGRMRKDVALQDVLHRAMGKAGIVRHYQHACRKRGCGHKETAMDSDRRTCPVCQRQLWVKAVVRPLRFHDLRHTAASLLLQQGADLVAVSEILRHSDPKLTKEVYGHLTAGYLLREVDKLSFGSKKPVELPAVAVASGGAGAEPPRTSIAQPEGPETKKAGNPRTNPEGLPAFSLERETGFEPATLSLGTTLTPSTAAPNGSQPLLTGGNRGQAPQEGSPLALQPLATDATGPNPGVAPVLRPASPPAAPRGALRVVPRDRPVLLTVRAVAARLGVSKATVYKLATRGALPSVRVGTALRFSPAALAAFEVGLGSGLK